MNVLVTGGQGFLGRWITARLAARGNHVTAFDTTIDRGPATPSNITLFQGDITAMVDVIEAFRRQPFDAVVHCAAIVGVVDSIKSPNRVVDVNVQGSLNLFEAMREFSVTRMVHISSIEVYGDFETAIAAEDHALRPIMPYGICKAAVEQFGRTYGALHGLECVNLRGSWIYGPDLPRPRLPNLIVDQVLNGEAVNIPKGGESVMDYVHVEDFTDAVVAALDRKTHRHDAYNVGSGEGTSVRALVRIIRSLLPQARISVGPGRYEFAPGLPMRVQGALDIARAREDLNYAPKYDLKRGLGDLIRAGGG